MTLLGINLLVALFLSQIKFLYELLDRRNRVGPGIVAP